MVKIDLYQTWLDCKVQVRRIHRKCPRQLGWSCTASMITDTDLPNPRQRCDCGRGSAHSLWEAGESYDCGKSPLLRSETWQQGEVLSCQPTLGKGWDWLGSWTLPECTEACPRRFKKRADRAPPQQASGVGRGLGSCSMAMAAPAPHADSREPEARQQST